MFKIVNGFLAAFVMFACSFAFAQEPGKFEVKPIVSDGDIMNREVFSPYTISMSGLNYPFVLMEDVIAREKMTQDEFAHIVAGRLVALAKTTPVEFCSQFCLAPSGEYGARITTVRSRLFCPIADVCPENMSKVGFDSIHNHIGMGKYRQTRIDQILSASTALATVTQLRVSQEADKFSERDFEHPGYMISMLSYDLKYQSAREVRLVSKIAK